MTHLYICPQTCQNKLPMEVKLAVLADFASVAREGKLNILGVFDAINPPVFPFVLPIFYVVLSYEAGAAEFGRDKQVEIVLSDDDGNRLLSMSQTLRVIRPDRAGTKSTTNQICGIVGFVFKTSGDYQFEILINEESKKVISLRVNEPKQKEK